MSLFISPKLRKVEIVFLVPISITVEISENTKSNSPVALEVARKTLTTLLRNYVQPECNPTLISTKEIK